MVFNPILLILVWFSLVCLVSIIPLLFLQIIYPSAIHFIVTKLGIPTTARVITSQRCGDPEDVCVCGVYSYHDRLNWEHKVKFRYCWHWPSREEWDHVMKSCGPGGENTVYYLPWFPFIREIQWNVDNPNIGEPGMEKPEK